MIWSELSQRMVQWSDRVALRVGELHITYSELLGLVESVSCSWDESDGRFIRYALIKQPDSVSVLLYILACWRSGIVPVVLRDNAPDAQLKELIDSLRPDFILLDPVNPDKIKPVAGPVIREPRFQKRSEALIISTSGSIGVPKLVVLPAESICINAETISSSLELTHEDRLAVSTPLTYMYGLMGGAMAGLWAGAAVHLFNPRMPPSIIQGKIRRDQLTVFQSPPSGYRLFSRYWNSKPFPDVRIVTTGGEYLGHDTADEIYRMFPRAKKLFLYGMTEAGPRISHDNLDDARFLEGGIGQPYSHIEWRITPVDDTRSFPVNVGRLLLRGPSIFLGYLNPVTGKYMGIDDRGWFHSSDLLLKDAAGHLHFYGRVDRLFKSGGKLVNPVAVEQVLSDHPGVRAVRCRSEAHTILGLVPVVDIVVVSGIRVSEEDLQSLCRKYLDGHAVPGKITLYDKLPVSGSGKMGQTLPEEARDTKKQDKVGLVVFS